MRRNINSDMCFHFRLFTEKFHKIFQKIQKIPFLGQFWSLLRKIRSLRIFLEHRTQTVFSFPKVLKHAKKLERNNEPLLRETVNDRQTKGQADILLPSYYARVQ